MLGVVEQRAGRAVEERVGRAVEKETGAEVELCRPRDVLGNGEGFRIVGCHVSVGGRPLHEIVIVFRSGFDRARVTRLILAAARDRAASDRVGHYGDGVGGRCEYGPNLVLVGCVSVAPDAIVVI